MKKGIIFIFIVFIAFTSCSKSSSDTGGGTTTNCSNIPKSFSTDVNPVIQSTCAVNSGCHGSGSINGPGELLTYTQIFDAKVNIRTAVSSGTMPKTGSLTNQQKNSIICWIDSGATNN
jgi:hypothetical protein